jgi:hypothetical protein
LGEGEARAGISFVRAMVIFVKSLSYRIKSVEIGLNEGVCMRRTVMNFWLDILIFIAFIGMTSTGVLLLDVPHGFGGTILGLTRYDWGDLHWVSSLLFVFLIMAHLVLHWNWTKYSCKKHLGVGPKTLAIVLVVMVLLFCIIAPIYLTKDFPSRKEFKRAYQRGLSGEIDIGIINNLVPIFTHLPDVGPSGKSTKSVEKAVMRDEKRKIDRS